MIFGGSFVTDKVSPNDVDILVELTPKFALQMLQIPNLVRVFDHALTEPYMVQAKPWAPGARPRAF